MPPPDEIEHLLRTEAPQVLGALVRRFSRFDTAEDATQEALLVASRRWPEEGIPDEPRSWLIRVGYRRMVDLLRSEQAARRREQEVAQADPAIVDPAGPAPQVADQDDSLLLLFLCCHSALSPPSQVALTLRAVGGLTTAEIARAYGAAERSMSTRISRAKQTLKDSGARFTAPTDDQDERIAAVMHVLYLIFNEGYTATGGDRLSRTDLSAEAIRLTRTLHRLLPNDREVAGLLALMLLIVSRDATRTDEQNHLVQLEDQDRSRWDQALIAEGVALIEGAWVHRQVGAYQLQAAVAAIHARAKSADETDWPQIAALYLWLERLAPTAPIRLSRVVAVSKAFGPQRALALLDDLDLAEDPLVRHRAAAVRAHLLEATGRREEARAAYLAAAELATNEVERRYLLDRASASC
ncbi:RNA polymerase sigma factor [Kribbella italica]|uniref:RNA polymerase sigma factor (Sigma-70 family) n=1 Tax=Kribbella italica TaxID=1540520 RepID=A0A7W9JGH3_9ACTN|nr:sigma-70 family RNA polymerase sigma factor [Kribbella italica]MBB5841048.1 RNA polymerase sigma factor (sigma-70 family) [Kribbella italica]